MFCLLSNLKLNFFSALPPSLPADAIHINIQLPDMVLQIFEQTEKCDFRTTEAYISMSSLIIQTKKIVIQKKKKKIIYDLI